MGTRAHASHQNMQLWAIPLMRRVSTIANSTTVPLLQLPAEIRERIFRYALTSSTGTICILAGLGNKTKTPSKGVAWSLPATCRQVYSETATLAYHCNTFCIHKEAALRRFCENVLPAQVDALREMRLASASHFLETS